MLNFAYEAKCQGKAEDADKPACKQDNQVVAMKLKQPLQSIVNADILVFEGFERSVKVPGTMTLNH